MPFPIPTLIYHITHIDNLPLILRHGGLQCKRGMEQAGTECTSIAYEHIQDRRDQRPVPCGPLGNLHDYVPFYFAPRSPMLYTISRGNVPGRAQKDIIYLVSTVQAVQQATLPFVFTDLHAVLAYTHFYTNPIDLDHVDWNLMQARYWFNTIEDPDRKSRRSAEFLVHGFFPWGLVAEIGVMGERMLNQVRGILVNYNPQPVVNIRGNWYY